MCRRDRRFCVSSAQLGNEEAITRDSKRVLCNDFMMILFYGLYLFPFALMSVLELYG